MVGRVEWIPDQNHEIHGPPETQKNIYNKIKNLYLSVTGLAGGRVFSSGGLVEQVRFHGSVPTPIEEVMGLLGGDGTKSLPEPWGVGLLYFALTTIFSNNYKINIIIIINFIYLYLV